MTLKGIAEFWILSITARGFWNLLGKLARSFCQAFHLNESRHNCKIAHTNF